MIRGCFVSYKGWRIWVWNSMLDQNTTPTYQEAAKEVYKSGWLKENKYYVQK